MNPQVVIIGGGPAGLSAGVALADHGVSVLICEAGADPGIKPCGEGLLPSALNALDLLGVDETDLRDAGSPLLGVRYISESGQRAEGRFAQGTGLGLERKVLQRLLRGIAQRKPGLGLLQADARVVKQADGTLSVRVEGELLTPQLIIGADGLNSRARKAAGLTMRRPTPFRYGLRQHFTVPCWTQHVEVHWSARAEAYVTPVGNDLVNIAVLWRDGTKADGERRGAPDWRSLFPELAQRLAGAVPAHDSRAYGPLHVDVKTPACDGFVLLGDAAGYIDAITGEGVGLAVSKARALARHLAPTLLASDQSLSFLDLQPYLAAAHELSAHHVRLTRWLLLVRRAPWLLERTIRALGDDPALFGHFLSANQGDVSPFRVPLRSALGLSWQLARPPAVLKAIFESYALRH